jgi:hypothetical protein
VSAELARFVDAPLSVLEPEDKPAAEAEPRPRSERVRA